MIGVPADGDVRGRVVELPVGPELWDRVFIAAPLVLVGTKEGDGWNVAPKHLAMPLGWEGFFCFACAPRHGTYRNLREHPQFTVSYPRPEQVLASGLAAGGRAADGAKPSLAALVTEPARVVDGRVVSGCWLTLECEVERLLDGFGPNSLVIGRVLAASAAPDALRGPDVDDADLVHRLGLLAYLAPGRFGVVRESLAFPYPYDYRR
jgi:flavin reductase (DIM6/NTAB) family NADH-FMN oxidoreductase RutF